MSSGENSARDRFLNRPPSDTDDDAAALVPAQAVEDEICESIYSAILDQRLPPGTKLSEAALCEAFNAGRARIRRVLLILSNREVIQLHANRGAFVAEPSAEEARAIFEARRTIEPTIIANVCRYSTKVDVARLRKMVADEQRERAYNNRRQAIRLSGAFHVELAMLSHNQVFEGIIKQLVARTSLIIGLYGKHIQVHCAEDDHEKLLEAIERRDEKDAAELMLSHVQHIEQEIDLESRDKNVIDVKRVFSRKI
jgi:DNA-binding GntR family transcriptional regulator